MLFQSKKINKTHFKKVTSEEILKCHLFSHLPEIIFDLCSQKKSLKNFLVLSISHILSNSFDENYYIIDEFRSEFSDWLFFLNKDEDSLTELEEKFRIFVLTLSTKFPLNKDVFHFIVLIIGLLLQKETTDPHHHVNTVKLDIRKILRINVRFKTLRKRLSHLDKIFIEKIVALVMRWKDFFLN